MSRQAASLELLMRSTRRLSASSPRLARGAVSLAPSELDGMLTQLRTLSGAIGDAKAVVTTELGPITPPPMDEVRGSATLPYFDRLTDLPDVEGLAGAAREPPVVIPIQLSVVPDKVETFADVSNALQQAAAVCRLLPAASRAPSQPAGLNRRPSSARCSPTSEASSKTRTRCAPRSSRTSSCAWCRCRSR